MRRRRVQTSRYSKLSKGWGPPRVAPKIKNKTLRNWCQGHELSHLKYQWCGPRTSEVHDEPNSLRELGLLGARATLQPQHVLPQLLKALPRDADQAAVDPLHRGVEAQGAYDAG